MHVVMLKSGKAIFHLIKTGHFGHQRPVLFGVQRKVSAILRILVLAKSLRRSGRLSTRVMES